MALTQARMGEIALMIVERQLRQRGVPLPENFDLMADEAARDYGITKEDARDFLQQITHKVIAEVYGPPPR